MDLQDRRELFVDPFLIETLQGTRLALQHPREENIALRMDRPWATSGGYFTVLKDGDLYRLYFSGRSQSGADDEVSQVTCYAQSGDGITWEQPELGLFEVMGTRKNNVVHAGHGPTGHNFSPFIDTRPGVPEDQRYKAIGGHKTTGLLVFHSPDGIHWRRAPQGPIQPPSPGETRYDSQNLAFWSAHEGCYCCYFRLFADGVRTIARTTSEDFLEWTEPVRMSFGDTPMEHLYINQTHPYFRAPHLYVALPARFMKDRKILSDEEGKQFGIGHHRGVGYWQDCAEGVFMTSRGGNRYDRTFMEGFIRPGLDRRNWASRCNYPALGVVPTGDQEMSLYITRHNQQQSAHLQRFSLRTDGFASVNAPYAGGEMLTRPFTFSGNKLVVNYATGAAGHILTEIQDRTGAALAGFTLADADPLIGDEIDRIVTWKGVPDVSRLAGQPIRLRFAMKDADLFAMQFKRQG